MVSEYIRTDMPPGAGPEVEERATTCRLPSDGARIETSDALDPVEIPIERQHAGVRDPPGERRQVSIGEVEPTLRPELEGVAEEDLVDDLDPGEIEEALDELGRPWRLDA